jgi:hypothetical protein
VGLLVLGGDGFLSHHADAAALAKANVDYYNGDRSFSGPAWTRWVAGDRARGLSELRQARETTGGAQADVVRGPAAILS